MLLPESEATSSRSKPSFLPWRCLFYQRLSSPRDPDAVPSTVPSSISWMREPRLCEVAWSVQFGAGWNQGLTSLALEFCLEKEKAQTKGVCWEGSALS